MDHFEMVEKLRQKANVSYEEAKAALEASDWDILDALVLLESEGKVKGEEAAPEYTTQEKPLETAKQDRHDWKTGLGKVWEVVKKLFQKGNANQFIITRKDKEVTSMPITVMVLLLILLWPVSAIALFVALFFGVRYSFRGPDINGKVNDVMNSAMDKAAAAVEIHTDDNKD